MSAPKSSLPGGQRKLRIAGIAIGRQRKEERGELGGPCPHPVAFLALPMGDPLARSFRRRGAFFCKEKEAHPNGLRGLTNFGLLFQFYLFERG